MGRISRTLDRISSENQEAGELKQDAVKAGCSLIASQADRSVVTIHGVLRSVTLRPVDGVTALEAELYDGSAGVTLIWLGRRKIEGVAAGRQLKAYGRIGTRGGDRVIYNPSLRTRGMNERHLGVPPRVQRVGGMNYQALVPRPSFPRFFVEAVA